MAFSASPEALVELNSILEVIVELKTAPVAYSSRADHTAEYRDLGSNATSLPKLRHVPD
jgi:hypothetical protein